LVWLNCVCARKQGEQEGGNPFFIGQVKILTIHLKTVAFNKPVEVSAPKGHCGADPSPAMARRPVGLIVRGGVGVLMLYIWTSDWG